MASDVSLQVADDGYRIRVGEECSDISDFGEPIEFLCDGKLYLAFADIPGDTASDVESPLSGWVYMATDTGAEIEEVDGFEEDEEEDGDEGEDEEAGVEADEPEPTE